MNKYMYPNGTLLPNRGNNHTNRVQQCANNNLGMTLQATMKNNNRKGNEKEQKQNCGRHTA